MLINVLVKRAAKSTRPGSATLITGALYSLLVKYARTTDQDPSFSAAPYDGLLALGQFSSDESINPYPVLELDNWTYFLITKLQEFNPDAEGLESIELSKLGRHPSLVAGKTRKNWVQYQHEVTCPKLARAKSSSISRPLISPLSSPKHNSLNSASGPETATQNSSASPNASPSMFRSPLGLAIKSSRQSVVKDVTLFGQQKLLSMRDYNGEPIIEDIIPFSTCMMDLM